MAGIVKLKPIYEGKDKIGEGKGKNDSLVGKTFKIISYAELDGKEGEKPFVVALLEVKGKEVTTTFSNIILKTLQETAKTVGTTADEADDRVQVFNEALDVTLAKIESAENKGRTYYTLENAE